MSGLRPAGRAGGRRPGQRQCFKQGGQRCTITSVHRPREGTWSCGVTEPQRSPILCSLTSVSVTAEGGPLAVPTGAFFEPAAHSNLTPPRLFSLRPPLIILPATPCRPPSSTLPSCTAKYVAKQCTLAPSPFFPFSPFHVGVWSLLSTKTTVLRVTGDLHVARSRRHLQPHPPTKGHVRLSRTLRYLWVENSVVGTVTVSLSYSLNNPCQAPAMGVIWVLSQEEPGVARLRERK